MVKTGTNLSGAFSENAIAHGKMSLAAGIQFAREFHAGAFGDNEYFHVAEDGARSTRGSYMSHDSFARMATYYERSRLVPFIGSGMSAPRCKLWPELIATLEAKCQIPSSTEEPADAASLVRRAQKVSRTLRNNSPEKFMEALQPALEDETAPLPAQTEALAQMYWPLVVSTNYDSVYFRAAQKYQHPPLVVGRGARDCQLVLHAQNAPHPAILWAIQGLGGPRRGPWGGSVSEPLANSPDGEIVLGHEEYRRVTYGARWFRSTFAEIFRSNCFLFLGSGLNDPYLLDLFGEIIEVYGPVPVPHYAFCKAGGVDCDFLLTRLNIQVIEYKRHEDVPDYLAELKQCTAGRVTRATGWRYTLPGGKGRTPLVVELRNEEAHPRNCLKPEHGLVTSVGLAPGDEILHGKVSRVATEHVESETGQQLKHERKSPHLWQVQNTNLFYAAARQPDAYDKHDLRIVAETTSECLDAAARVNLRTLHVVLLAAGPSKTFPALFSFSEMLRGIGLWASLSERATRLQRVIIYIVDPSVTYAIRSRRFDPAEILSSGDVRFSLEIVRVGSHTTETEHHNLVAHETGKIGDLLKIFCIQRADDWHATLIPSPTGHVSQRALSALWDQSVVASGIVTGSRLSITKADLRAKQPPLTRAPDGA